MARVKKDGFKADDLKAYEEKFSTKKVLGVIGKRFGYRCFQSTFPDESHCYTVYLYKPGDTESCYVQTFSSLAEVCFFIGNVELFVLLKED